MRRTLIIVLALTSSFASGAAATPGDPDTLGVSMPPAMLDSAAAAPSPPMPRSRGFDLATRMRDLGPIDPARIQQADAEAEDCPGCGPGALRLRTGLLRTTVVPVQEGELHRTALVDGRSMWTIAIRSPGALRMRLHFSHLDLGSGSMIVWSEGAAGPIVRGPYLGRGPDDDGELWTASVPGDTVHIEVMGTDRPTFTIEEVVHRDRGEAPLRPAAVPAGGAAAGGSGVAGDGGSNGGGVFSCHNDALCYSDPDDDIARRATGQMNFASGGNEYVCTGTLLNDFDGETSAPYFLTAYHCLHTESEANSLEVVWLWQKSACNGTLPDYDALPRSTGADYLVSSPTDGGNDMSFVRLDGLLPGGLALAGWTTAHPSNARGFHHPSGSWRRGTTFEAVGICTWCLCVDSADYDYYEMADGLVEGGSSGSGIFNTSGQLFGQLLGRCGGIDDPDDMNCSNLDDYRAMYGEFETTYPIVDFYLESLGGTFWVNANQPSFPPQNGGPSAPFDLVSEGYAAAFDGAQLKIHAGNYDETLVWNKVLVIEAVNGSVTIGQ